MLVLYTITVSGFALNLHYCFDRLASIRIDAPAKECGKPGAKKMTCCKDKHFVVKVKDAHQNTSFLFSGKIFAAVLPRLCFSEFTLATQEASLNQPNYRGPPLSPPVSAYLLNRNFRI